MNLRSVTTRVTVNDAHSVVNTNTELMHKYCVTQFAIKKIHRIGIDVPTSGTAIDSLALAMATCSAILLYINKNPGNGNKCWKYSISSVKKRMENGLTQS